MPVYVYETTDPAKPVRRFEIKQSMRDEPLRTDPETGEPVRRVIIGGYLAMRGNAANSSNQPSPSRGCGPSCRCH